MIRPRIPEGQRVYAIGDVHGRLDCLLAMERLIAADQKGFSGQVTEVWLGDYIDRGPDSRGVIQRLMTRKAGGERLVTLRGNHEVYALEFATEIEQLQRWLLFGGREALASYGLDLPRMTKAQIVAEAARITAEGLAAIGESHLAFYRDTQLSWRCGDYFFVHAGVRPGVPLQRQTPHDMTTIREPFHSQDGDFGAFIIHGHTPAPRPVVKHNRICIDTTAWETGVLTCVVLEGDAHRFLHT